MGFTISVALQFQWLASLEDERASCSHELESKNYADDFGYLRGLNSLRKEMRARLDRQKAREQAKTRQGLVCYTMTTRHYLDGQWTMESVFRLGSATGRTTLCAYAEGTQDSKVVRVG